MNRIYAITGINNISQKEAYNMPIISLPEKPEILSPAGNFEKLKSALLFGADAVYFSGKNFGMRSAAGNFTLEEIEEACGYTHEHGKKLYLTVNAIPGSGDIDDLKNYLNEIKNLKSKPDALICADIGVVSLVKKMLLKLISTYRPRRTCRIIYPAWRGPDLG